MKQSQKWVNANLITADQRTAILSFENKNNNRSFWNFAYVGAGLFIGLGVILLIASNWSAIPAGVKLFADFALLGTLLYGVYWSVTENHPHYREVLAIVSFLLIGGSIGLIGQIFQLSGSWYSLAFFWALLGLPLVLISRTRVLSAAWLLLLLSAVNDDIRARIFTWLFDSLSWKTVCGILLLYGASCGCAWLAERIQNRFVLPATAARCFKILTYILIWTVGSTFGLAQSFDCTDSGCLLTQLAAHAIVLGFFGWRLYIAICQQKMRAFRANAIMIELYIFAIFMAQFSDLWTTGLGFIGGGLLILGFIWLLRRTTRYIKGMEVFGEK